MKFIKQLEEDISNYKDKNKTLPGEASYNEYKLKKRIYQFKNKHYPTGKLTERGAYKYYFDIITPRVNDELKNVRILSNDITYYSIAPEADSLQVLIANRNHSQISKETGEDDKLNLINSLYTEDGNVIEKIVGDTHEPCNPLSIFITNITAESIDDTNVIEHANLTYTELKKKRGVWDTGAVNKLLDGKKVDETTPTFEIYEYTGEVSETDYNELKGRTGGDENKYFLAKIIVSSPKDGESQVLFAEKYPEKKMSDFYRHARRGNYKGKFWGEGMYELLFDYQIRANEIGNQIARGLEFASKAIFKATDLRTYASIKTDLVDGDIINSADLAQVDVRMHGLDQLIADWNRNIQEANRVANSSEIVYGGQLNARTPFKLGNLYNENANKYYGLLKQKLGYFYSNIIEDIFKKNLIKKLSGKKIITLAGSDDILNALREEIVEKWYLDNLAEIGPHSKEEAEIIKQEKLAEISEKDITVNNTKEFWSGAIDRIHVSTVGENSKVQDNLQNLTVLLQMETDPIRRAYLLDNIYRTLGVPLPPAPQPELAQNGSGGVSMMEEAAPQSPQAPQAGELSI